MESEAVLMLNLDLGRGEDWVFFSEIFLRIKLYLLSVNILEKLENHFFT